MALSPTVTKSKKSAKPTSDSASWNSTIFLVALIIISSTLVKGSCSITDEPASGRPFLDRPCDEIYTVGEGETLHSISVKCGDPFIMEQNPHIDDPDDAYPGLVIKITPSKPEIFLK